MGFPGTNLSLTESTRTWQDSAEQACNHCSCVHTSLRLSSTGVPQRWVPTPGRGRSLGISGSDTVSWTGTVTVTPTS